MQRTRAIALICFALAGAYLGARPATAAACSVPPDKIVVSDTPANGLVMVGADCYTKSPCFEGELPDVLEVVDFETREPVSGSIERVEGDLETDAKIAWRPDQRLTAGRDYEVLWQPQETASWGAEVDYVFRALPASDWAAQDVVVLSRLELASQDTELIQCEALPSLLCGIESSIYPIGIERRTYPTLSVEVDWERVPENSEGQFVLSAAFWAEGDEEPQLQELSWKHPRLPTNHFFDDTADAYCFRVQVTSLVDDSVAMHEGCEEHGDLGEPATTAVPDEHIRAHLAQCKDAPTGYEQAWCEVRRVSCDQPGQAPDCDAVAAACEDIDEAVPDAGPPPDDDDDDVTPDDDDDVTPDDDDEDAPKNEADDGCSVGGARSSSDALVWGAAITVLAWRRRRSSAR
jgi:hypothetical protein